MPVIRFGTYHEFFQAVEPLRESFETYRGEIGPFATGCYTSQARIKKMNRITEARINEAEALAAQAFLTAGGENRQAVLEKSWRDILFNQFHDILPGTCLRISREHALGHYQDALARIFPTSNYAMRKIAACIDTSSVPFDDECESLSEGAGVGVFPSDFRDYRQPAPERSRGAYRVLHFFNTTPYDRCEPVECTLWNYKQNIYETEVVTPDGEPVPFTVTVPEDFSWGNRICQLRIQVSVPAMGWVSYVVRPAQGKLFDRGAPHDDAALGYKTQKLRIGDDGHLLNAGWVDIFCDSYINDNPYVLQNDKLYAEFDPLTLELRRLVDRESGRSLIDAPSAYFTLIHENARHGMTAWRVGEHMNVRNLNRTCDTHVYRYTRRGADEHRELVGYKEGIVEPMEGTEGTGLYEQLCYDMRFEHSSVRVEIGLKAGQSVLEYRLTVDWNEKGEPEYMTPQLAFSLPIGYGCAEYTYDIPYGLIQRKPRRQDVAAGSFVFAPSGESRSIGLMSDCKHGFRSCDNTLTVSLIRGSSNPDPLPDQGSHTIGLGIAVARDAVEMKKLSDLFSHPICYTSGNSHPGTLPFSMSTLRLTGEGLRLSVMKCAESGDGLILRLNNLLGQPVEGTLTLPADIRSLWLTDSCERPQQELAVQGRTASVTVEPYATVTLLVR